MIAQKMMIAVSLLRQHHRDRARHVAEQAEHVCPLAAEEVADLAPDEDEGGGDERFEGDGRLHAADRGVQVLHHSGDRHVHQRCVDDQHEHRHREKQGELRVVGACGGLGILHDSRSYQTRGLAGRLR